MTRTEIQALRERVAEQMMRSMFVNLFLGASIVSTKRRAGTWFITLSEADAMELCDLAEQALEDET